MPHDLWVKSMNLLEDIDLSLFAHIHLDPFLRGTYELEGNSLLRTSVYLTKYLAKLAEQGPLPEEVLKTQEKIQQLIEIEMRLSLVDTKAEESKSAATEMLNGLSKQLVTDLMALPEDASLVMPGGWKNAKPPGHGMIYQFKRTETAFEFYIYNAGAGIQYHERESMQDRELYYPIQAYSIPLPVNEEKLAVFLKNLMLARISKLRNDTYYDEKSLYETVLPGVSFLNATLFSVAERMKHTLTAGQLSGTCTQRSLHQLLKAQFKTLPDYQRFIYQFKRHALDDYMRVLEEAGEFQDARVHQLITHAMHTLLRTLATPELFSSEEIERERAQLHHYQMRLDQAKKQDASEERSMSLNEPVELTTTFSTTCPVTLRPRALNPASSSKEVNDCLLSLEGGPGLLSQLEALNQHCQRLLEAGDYVTAMRQLESVFISLPLPTTREAFHEPLDFYEAVHDGNKETFYHLLLSLEDAYVTSCNKYLAKNVATPSMITAGLSVFGVVDYVSNQWPLIEESTAEPPSYVTTLHEVTKANLKCLLRNNLHNPYFATNDPVQSERFQLIKSLFSVEEPYTTEEKIRDARSRVSKLIDYYKTIIHSMPLLEAKLLERYCPPKDPLFARALETEGCSALYCLINTMDDLSTQEEFQPLIQKIKLQQLIEQCRVRSLSLFSSAYEWDFVLQMTYQNPKIILSSKERELEDVYFKSISKYKYALLADTTFARALSLDDNVDSVFHERSTDNQIQLRPAEFVSNSSLSAEQNAMLTHRMITGQEIADRELFHLRQASAHQIVLTLLYFQRHMNALSHPNAQKYVEANVFEPGLLTAELDKGLQILNQMDSFIHEGQHHFMQQGVLDEPILFFIRLDYLVNCHLEKYQPHVAHERLLTLLQRLKALLVLAKEQANPAIEQGLHLYQFLTIMACIKQDGMTAIETKSMLALALQSYFYINAKNNLSQLDTASRVDLAYVQQDMQHLLLENKAEDLSTELAAVFEPLDLGVCEEITREADFTYLVRLKQGTKTRTLRVDLLHGSIFNEVGMAYTPIPIDIMNHPVFTCLQTKPEGACFRSGDHLRFEWGTPALRFIRSHEVYPYRLQQQWTVAGETHWYELHALSEIQKKAFGLETQVIKLPFPSILAERGNQIWVDCERPGVFLITQQNQPAYQYVSSLKALQSLDINGGSLCVEFPPMFSRFEDADFITVFQQAEGLQIEFGRYGLTVMATRDEVGGWVYHLKDNPHYVLNQASIFPEGVAHLVFEDQETQQRKVFFPVQRFLYEEKQSAHSEFYHFKQDTSAHISQSTAGNSSLPWQYTNSERLIQCSLGADNQIMPETAADALYLCYVYLGSQQPEKAWAILEEGLTRLGGLKGTADELLYLSWIIKALPYHSNQSDTTATLATPTYVACQLKALACMVKAMPPEHQIDFPMAEFDLKTPEGRASASKWEEAEKFYNNLRTELYTLYTRFQHMKRHATHEFQLSDDEKKWLLNYYHIKVKALGALGYEWQQLRLQSVIKEYEMLAFEAQVKGTLPPACQQRLMEIEVFLTREMVVRAHHTDIELIPIDTSLPKDTHISYFAINFATAFIKTSHDSAGADEAGNLLKMPHILPNQWWYSNKFPILADMMPDAMKALTPEMSMAHMLCYFPCYYQLVISQEPSDAREKLLDFCRKFLIAHRHTPLAEQKDNRAYLCNILCRIAENREIFLRKLPRENMNDVLATAKNLPDPKLSIYQIVDHTKEVFVHPLEAPSSESFAVRHRMMASSSLTLTDLSFESLCDHGDLSDEQRAQLREDARQYKEQASRFGMASATTTADTEASGLHVLSEKELEAGREQSQAWQNMQRIASRMLADSATVESLQHVAHTFVEQLETTRAQQLNDILQLANSGPDDPIKKQYRDLAVEGASRPFLDITRLLALFVKADNMSYAEETGLSEAQIEQLHTALSHYVAASVRQKTWQRFCDADPSNKASMAQALLTEDLVDYQTEPVLALLQYHESILLRPQQLSAIKRLLSSAEGDHDAFPEIIEKVIMGGGKSKVILPILAQCKATGSNLVVIEVPHALFETNSLDLSYTSSTLFNKRPFLFEFNRDSPCSPQSLQFLYETLTDVMVDKAYVITTGESIQSLELKYLELLLQGPGSEENDQKVWKDQIKCLEQLVLLFRTRADAVIDEVHQSLLLKKKLNYTLGEQRLVPTEIIDACVALYRFFDHVALNEVLGEAFEGMSWSDLLKSQEFVIKDTDWPPLMAHLATRLVYDEAGPLGILLQSMSPPWSNQDKDALIHYLLNEGIEIPACVLQSPPASRTIFALNKEQISHILPYTLKRKLREHYGPSSLHPDTGLAIPYVANNIPNERSQFGHHLEAMDYSIQMLLIEGFSEALLRRYLTHLKLQARQELQYDPSLGDLQNTPTARTFQDAVLPDSLSLNQIDLDDDEQFKSLFVRLSQNRTLIFHALQTDILTQQPVDSEILHSDAYHHVDSYRSCQGITGTPSNSSTYHQRLMYHQQTMAATDGFILARLKEKQTTLRKIPQTSLEARLTHLFATPNKNVRAVIDICALFKGISNLEVSQSIRQYIQAHPEQFSEPCAIKYVLFFNEKNMLCALNVHHESELIILGSTDPELINKKLGCTPEARFSYYDQSHIFGVDLRQAESSRALVLVDQDTSLEPFLQGCMRMREFQNQQSVEIIMPEYFDVASLDVLIAHLAENERRQLEKDNFSAVHAKMTNVIRNDLMQRLLAVDPHDVAKKVNYVIGCKPYFVKSTPADFFAMYGGLSSKQATEQILMAHREHLLHEWLAILSVLGETLTEKERHQLHQQLDDLIAEALPRCLTEYLSPMHHEQGHEVQVQQEVQIERETQLECVCFSPSLTGLMYKKWATDESDVPFLTRAPEKRSLTELCRQCDPKDFIEFDGVYASQNYYQTYYNQQQFFDAYLKPVHVLLFSRDVDGKLSCCVLSQKEAEDLSARLKNNPIPDVWLTTTQHTVLIGTPPEGIVEDKKYQELIEKARFFNGELSSLLNDAKSLAWILQDTSKKLKFFKAYLHPNRELTKADLVLFEQTVTQLADIIEHFNKPIEGTEPTYHWPREYQKNAVRVRQLLGQLDESGQQRVILELSMCSYLSSDVLDVLSEYHHTRSTDRVESASSSSRDDDHLELEALDFTSMSPQMRVVMNLLVEKQKELQETSCNTPAWKEKRDKQLNYIQRDISILLQHPQQDMPEIIETLKGGRSFIERMNSTYYQSVIKPILHRATRVEGINQELRVDEDTTPVMRPSNRT